MRRLITWLVSCCIALALLSAAVGIATRPCRMLITNKQVAAAGSVLAQYDYYDAGNDGTPQDYLDANGNNVTAQDYVNTDEPCYEPQYFTPVYEEMNDETYYTQPYDYSTYEYPDYQTGGVTWYTPHIQYTTTNTIETYTPTLQSFNVYTPAPTLRETIVPIGVPTGGIIIAPEVPQPVNPPRPTPPLAQEHNPTCYISAYPSSVNAWENASLSWGSEYAVAAYLTDFGNVAVSGGAQVVPGVSKIYTLTVQSPSGRTATCQTSVAVNRPLPVSYQTPSCYMSVSPTQIRAGDVAGLSWSSSDATSGYLNELGQVGTAGYYQFTPSRSQAYILSVVGPGGVSSCTANVVVAESPAPTPVPQGPAAPTCNISADVASIFSGSSAKITWSASRATDVSISSIGAVTAKGTRSVTPTSTQKYVLTAKGAGGTRSCSVTVTVTSPATCTMTCGGVVYACAPVNTPIAAVCPSVTTAPPTPAQYKSLWQWLKDLF